VNVQTLRVVLVLFKAMSGLKVNFHKSMLVDININETWLNEADSVLNCKVGRVPFMYFRLPISGDAMCLLFWELVLSRIKNRLSG